jgi:SAM-dependent methyltransferase
MEQLKIAPTPTFARDLIGQRISEHAQTLGRGIEILEAGCGRKWNIDLDGVSYRLTGIDLDAKALEYRSNVVGDLDEAIVGDLREVPLLKEKYDVVFSAFVLEHIKGAESVLDSMVAALKPGGLLVLRVPDGDGVYAFLARLLPFWTHVVYKRIADHDKLAGKPGHPPYRVVYDSLVSRPGFHEYITRHGLILVDELGTNPHLDGMGRLAPLGRAGQRAIAWLSRGRLEGSHSNLTLVMTKP